MQTTQQNEIIVLFASQIVKELNFLALCMLKREEILRQKFIALPAVDYTI